MYILTHTHRHRHRPSLINYTVLLTISGHTQTFRIPVQGYLQTDRQTWASARIYSRMHRHLRANIQTSKLEVLIKNLEVRYGPTGFLPKPGRATYYF